MTTDYKSLVAERNRMRNVMDNGRKGSVYHTQATKRYREIQGHIKSIFRNKAQKNYV